jgi:phage tail sheath protein FI
VYIEEIAGGGRTIAGVATSIAAFVGRAAHGPVATMADAPMMVHGFDAFEREFGELDPALPMTHAVRDFFRIGGSDAMIVRVYRAADGAGDGGAPLEVADYIGSKEDGTGLQALRNVDLFNLLCIPPDTRGGSTAPAVYQAALELCVERRAMLIVDAPHDWDSVDAVAADNAQALAALGLDGAAARNAALYFPRLLQDDPAQPGQVEAFVPCGAVAGVIARTDAQRGVWKAPAGTEAMLDGVQGLTVSLTDDENGLLNPIGVNCLRKFPVIGTVVWGARTLRGADGMVDDYKYVPVRRLALHLEESLLRGTRWAVFEPNAEPLWAQLRLNVGNFLHELFRAGAFQGQTPREAYFVKCDATTTTQDDIDRGVVGIVVGFAPLKPAEFVVIGLQQLAGQVAV